MWTGDRNTCTLTQSNEAILPKSHVSRNRIESGSARWLPFNGARHGDNGLCGGFVCGNDDTAHASQHEHKCYGQ